MADVNRLLGMIQKNSSHPLTFHLFSDESLPGLDPSIEKHPEPGRDLDCYHEKYNYRKEAALCDDALGGLTGKRVFFFDLDVLITGNLDELFDYPEGDNFYIINDWNTRGNHVGQASCYSFVVGKLGQIKVYFEANSENVINNFGTASQEYLSDQVQKLFGSLNFWPEEWFKSFKFHCLPVWFLRRFIVPSKPPVSTKVLAFHGHPDIEDALMGRWAPEGLKKSARGWKKIYKQCRKTDWIREYWK